MIKAVLIDIDNTLLDFNECARISFKCAFDEYGIEYRRAVDDVFFRINNKLWENIERGIITKKELHDVRWNMIFSELGIECDGVKFEDCFRKYLSESCEKVEGADEILSYLSAKFILCAASNGPQHQQEKRLANAGLEGYFDYIFTSEGLGCKKPDTRFFELCLEKMGNISPDEAVMIGDSLSADIVGAKNSGIMTCLFDYGKAATVSACNADFVVERLSDIKKIL